MRRVASFQSRSGCAWIWSRRTRTSLRRSPSVTACMGFLLSSRSIASRRRRVGRFTARTGRLTPAGAGGRDSGRAALRLARLLVAVFLFAADARRLLGALLFGAAAAVVEPRPREHGGEQDRAEDRRSEEHPS